MSHFVATDTDLLGVKLIRRQLLGDARGFFSRFFCAEKLAQVGWTKSIAQINHTFTAERGTIRGMHFQYPPDAEMKLVSCTRGEVWDVAVDLRRDSPTFLQWHAEHLSADNHCALLIPEGFAHGYQTLTDNVELLYCHSSSYAPHSEAGLHALDKRLAIAWPLTPNGLSVRDSGYAMIDDTFQGVIL